VDAHALAESLRDDPAFRSRALTDPGGVVAEYGLHATVLIETTPLLDRDWSPAYPTWCEQHAALFALVASARHDRPPAEPS
jgi:hypothetical protein